MNTEADSILKEHHLNKQTHSTDDLSKKSILLDLLSNGKTGSTSKKTTWDEDSDENPKRCKTSYSKRKPETETELTQKPTGVTASSQKPKPSDFIGQALPLSNEKYSLLPDMFFGWKPKMNFGAPIPLTYSSYRLDEILRAYYANSEYYNNQKGTKIVYHGFFPVDSFRMHASFQGPNTYTIKNSQLLFEKYQILSQYVSTNERNPFRPFKGMASDVSPNNLQFDSCFESGNLDTVFQTGPNEYDLYIRVDTNTRGHTSWFYFKLKNGKPNQTIKLNIMNFCKGESLYKRGMKPYIFSEKLYQEKQIGWTQGGENVHYSTVYHIKYEPPTDPLMKRKYYKLSFDYTFFYGEDVVSFAMCVPYTYSQLRKFTKEIAASTNARTGYDKQIIKESKLCLDLSGVEVPLLTITEDVNDEEENSRKPVLIAAGRIHPGETNGSWVVQGFIEWVCGTSEEAAHLRQKLVIKVIPMLNPDGVIAGNYRTGLAGNDLNRRFAHTDEKLHPTVHFIKKYVEELTARNTKIWAYLDFHGHSLRKNVFIYTPQFPFHSPEYYRVKVLPMILSKKTDMFRFHSCIFRISKGKMTTARALFAIDYGINNCFTIEASFAGYITRTRETKPFTTEALLEMGQHMGSGLSDYLKLLEEEDSLKQQQKIEALERKKIKHSMFQQQRMGKITKSLNNSSNVNLQGDNTDRIGTRGTKFETDLEDMRFYADFETEEAQQQPKKRSKVKKSLSQLKKKKEKEKEVFSNLLDSAGISKIISEIKNEIKSKGTEDDEVSEGGSDSESSDDDYQDAELNNIQRNILNNIEMFNSIMNSNSNVLSNKTIKKLRTYEDEKKNPPQPKNSNKIEIALQPCLKAVRPATSHTPERRLKSCQQSRPVDPSKANSKNTSKQTETVTPSHNPSSQVLENGQNYLLRMRRSRIEQNKAYNKGSQSQAQSCQVSFTEANEVGRNNSFVLTQTTERCESSKRGNDAWQNYLDAYSPEKPSGHQPEKDTFINGLAKRPRSRNERVMRDFHVTKVSLGSAATTDREEHYTTSTAGKCLPRFPVFRGHASAYGKGAFDLSGDSSRLDAGDVLVAKNSRRNFSINQTILTPKLLEEETDSAKLSPQKGLLSDSTAPKINNEKPVNFIDYSQLMLKNGKINLLGQPLPSPLANSTNQKLNGNTADQRAKSNSVSPTKGKLEIPPNLIGVLFAQQQQQTLQQQQSQVYHNHGFFGFNRAIKTRKKATRR